MNEGKIMNKYEASKSESQHQRIYVNKIRKSQLAHESKKNYNPLYPNGVNNKANDHDGDRLVKDSEASNEDVSKNQEQ